MTIEISNPLSPGALANAGAVVYAESLIADGTTDNYANLQAQLNAFGSPGGCLILPSGMIDYGSPVATAQEEAPLLHAYPPEVEGETSADVAALIEKIVA